MFFALEGTMVLLAAAILTACHPGTVPAYQASEADVKDKKKRQRGE